MTNNSIYTCSSQRAIDTLGQYHPCGIIALINVIGGIQCLVAIVVIPTANYYRCLAYAVVRLRHHTCSAIAMVRAWEYKPVNTPYILHCCMHEN